MYFSLLATVAGALLTHMLLRVTNLTCLGIRC